MASFFAKKSCHTKYGSLLDLSSHGNNNNITNKPSQKPSQPMLRIVFDPQTTHFYAQSSFSSLLTQSTQPLCTKDSFVEIKLLHANDVWDVFGNVNSMTQFSSTTSLVQYNNIICQFYCQFQLLVWGLNFDKSSAIFINVLPVFTKSNQALRDSTETTFKKTANYIESHLILQLEAYANK